METIDKEDTLTLKISKPEGQELTPIGEIQINILDLYLNKNKKYLIGDAVSIDLKIKYVLLSESEISAEAELYNSTSTASQSPTSPNDNTEEQAARRPSHPGQVSRFSQSTRSKSIIRVNEATLRMQALSL